MATFSTGIDSASFKFEFCEDKCKEEDDIPYSYGFFHLVFSSGAMYFAMLFISWNLTHPTHKWSIDVGWTSTWVKIGNEWSKAAIYNMRRQIKIYEEIARHSLNNNLLKYGVKGHLLNAGMCHLCKADVSITSALEKYQDLDPTFSGTRECKFLGMNRTLLKLLMKKTSQSSQTLSRNLTAWLHWYGL